MNTLHQFTRFLEELQALINKYQGDPQLLTKDQRITFAAAQTVPLYRETFDLIRDLVARAVGVIPGHVDQSIVRCRYARVAWARHIAMTFAHEFTDASLAAIGAYFNTPSHGSIGHARKNVALQCANFPEEQKFVDRLRLECRDALRKHADTKKALAELPPVTRSIASIGPAAPTKSSPRLRASVVKKSIP